MDSVDRNIFCDTAGSSQGRISALIREVPVQLVSDGEEDDCHELLSEYQSDNTSPATTVTVDIKPAFQHSHYGFQNQSQALISEQTEINGINDNLNLKFEKQLDLNNLSTTIPIDAYSTTQENSDCLQDRSQATLHENFSEEEAVKMPARSPEQAAGTTTSNESTKITNLKPRLELKTEKYEIRENDDERFQSTVESSETKETETLFSSENRRLEMTSEISEQSKQDHSISPHNNVSSNTLASFLQDNNVRSTFISQNESTNATINQREKSESSSHSLNNNSASIMTRNEVLNRQNVSEDFRNTMNKSTIDTEYTGQNYNHQSSKPQNADLSTQVSANALQPMHNNTSQYRASAHNCFHCKEKNNHIRFLQAQVLRLEANAKSESTENLQSSNLPAGSPSSQPIPSLSESSETISEAKNHIRYLQAKILRLEAIAKSESTANPQSPILQSEGATPQPSLPFFEGSTPLTEAPEEHKTRFRKILHNLATAAKQKLHLICRRRH